jgi:hypothetical protein
MEEERAIASADSQKPQHLASTLPLLSSRGDTNLVRRLRNFCALAHRRVPLCTISEIEGTDAVCVTLAPEDAKWIHALALQFRVTKAVHLVATPGAPGLSDSLAALRRNDLVSADPSDLARRVLLFIVRAFPCAAVGQAILGSVLYSFVSVPDTTEGETAWEYAQYVAQTSGLDQTTSSSIVRAHLGFSLLGFPRLASLLTYPAHAALLNDHSRGDAAIAPGTGTETDPAEVHVATAEERASSTTSAVLQSGPDAVYVMSVGHAHTTAVPVGGGGRGEAGSSAEPALLGQQLRLCHVGYSDATNVPTVPLSAQTQEGEQPPSHGFAVNLADAHDSCEPCIADVGVYYAPDCSVAAPGLERESRPVPLSSDELRFPDARMWGEGPTQRLIGHGPSVPPFAVAGQRLLRACGWLLRPATVTGAYRECLYLGDYTNPAAFFCAGHAGTALHDGDGRLHSFVVGHVDAHFGGRYFRNLCALTPAAFALVQARQLIATSTEPTLPVEHRLAAEACTYCASQPAIASRQDEVEKADAGRAGGGPSSQCCTCQ